MSDYTPAQIEPKWQEYWSNNGIFKTKNDGRKKFYCLDMFPYPSGSGLHLGHPVGYTATDTYSRFMRMRGFDVLHPMGWDAFGLPAEQHAVNTGEHPAIITEQNCERFKQQMNRLGLSYDWSREVFSCRSDYYRWTQWIFLRIYNSWFDEQQQKARPISELTIPESIKEQGELAIQQFREQHRLAYYANAMVNWCPALGTVLANEEVIDGKSERGGHDVVRKPMKQWMMRITKYTERLLNELDEIDWPASIKEQQRNWIGKKVGAEIQFQLEGSTQILTAFTTRADTLFGVTFFVISPEHPLLMQITSEELRVRVKAYCEASAKLSEFDRTLENRKKTGVFTGAHVRNPISRELVPVYVGDYVLSSVGTGAVMGVPAHDERDFEFARTFNIDVKPVIVPQSDDLELVEAVREGEQPWTASGLMAACEGEVARQLSLEGRSNSDAALRIVDWLERNTCGKRVTQYKLRDWLFSRQRYWGEPIPIIHWEDGTVTALSDSELPLMLPQVDNYKPSETGESPLARATDWLEVTDPVTGKRGRRETNTMPQWAGSCWYYLRFIDAKNTERFCDIESEKHFMPVDLYVGGAEHAVLHLLYSRFWHKVLFDLGIVSGREPFKRLVNQGMLLAHAYRDKRGALVPVDQVEERNDGQFVRSGTDEVLERIVAKMSKSLRNVVTPDEVVDVYGADTLRLYIMFMGPIDAQRIWDSKAVLGLQRFVRRAWQFVSAGKEFGVRDVVADKDEAAEVTKAAHRLVKRVGEDLERLQFNTAIAGMMEFLNDVAQSPVSMATLQRFVLVLAPFAPHLAEELWQRLGNKESLAWQAWPDFDPSLLVQSQVTVVVQVNGKKRATIDVAVDIAEDSLKQLVVERLQSTEHPVAETDRFITVCQNGTKVPKLVNVIVK